MKNLVLALAAAMTWLNTSVAVAQWPQQTFSNRHWEFEGGARISDRPGGGVNAILIRDRQLRTPLFSVNQATDLETAPGFDIRFLNKNMYGMEWEFESSYNQWDMVANITPRGNMGLNSPLFAPLQNAIAAQIPGATNFQFNSVNYVYDSYLLNLEFNAKRAVLPGVTLLAGPRFLHLKDDVTVGVNGQLDGPGFTNAQFTANTTIRTENPLFGFQTGTDFFVPMTRDLFITGLLKVGIYGNSARSRINQVVQPPAGFFGPPVTTAFNPPDRAQTAGVFEVGGKVHYDIIPGVMSLYTGYEAMWLTNVALGPPQLLNAVPPIGNLGAPVQITGTVFNHNILFGANIRF